MKYLIRAYSLIYASNIIKQGIVVSSSSAALTPSLSRSYYCLRTNPFLPRQSASILNNNKKESSATIGLNQSTTANMSSHGGQSKQVAPSKEELKKKLTPIQYHVTQEKGTERPGTGEYLHLNDKGMYECVVCGSELFSSETKFDSGCGWPAFYDIKDKRNVKLTTDTSHGMTRTEVTCAKCGAHLGHVFDDGYGTPTGQRYCINSAALKFKKKNQQQ